LPGRIRIEVCGLLHNRQIANRLVKSFASLKGIKKVEPCSATGRMLLVYDERNIFVDDILRRVLALESGFGGSGKTAPDEEIDSSTDGSCDSINESDRIVGEDCSEAAIAQMEAAPATELDTFEEHEGQASEDDFLSGEVAEAIRTVPKAAGPPAAPGPAAKVPLPLALAMGGLVALGAKQLLFGKSALARSPIPFYLSGAVAVVTGYPFLRRGVNEFSREKRINADLLLGTGALALALVRENLVVLAGLSILQYVNWKRSRHMPGRAFSGNTRLQRESREAWSFGGCCDMGVNERSAARHCRTACSQSAAGNDPCGMRLEAG
jgi:cation transport ATPase